MKRQNGLTLIELLLAMAIFVVIGLAGASIFNTVSKSEETTRNTLDRLNALQTAFIVIERDITQIARRHVRAAESTESSDDNFIYLDSDVTSDATGIGFVRHGWSNPALMLPRSELQSVAYRLVEDRLERVHYHYVDPVLGEEQKVRVLLTGITSLSFEFFYQRNWQKELNNGKMPKGIAIELETEAFGIIRRQYLVAGDDQAAKVQES